VAVARRDEDESSIWLMDVNSERINRITSGPLRDASLAWSPDGSRIVFNSRRGEVHGVYAVAANGGGQEEELLRSPEPKRITGISRDNRLLIYTAWSPETGMDVWALTATGDRKSQPIEQSRANESQGTPSPDGRWMAFVSDESGKDQIHVRALPPSEGRWQISIDGGTHPRWRGDGRELYFLSTDGRLMAVEVTRASPVEFGVPRMLVPLGRADGFDVSSDGRFLVQLPVDEPGGRELHVVLNWAAELRR
jgi:Tol biopolymer transport system component